ncbi:MAG: SMC-Scp complex subunit ScpB [Sedimentisphaerales bacterium]|nr:SMC-Scp complex subunit ScpB [Sedimentisphaerales bacterium]
MTDEQQQTEVPIESAETVADADEQPAAEIVEPETANFCEQSEVGGDMTAEGSEASDFDDRAGGEIDEQSDPEVGGEPKDEDDRQIGSGEPDEDFEVTVESVLEAVLFASDESLTAARLAGIAETGSKQVREHIENLNAKYRAANNAFRIEQIAGGYQMLTLSPYNHWLQKLLRVRSDGKLSPAALETLAIVAYKQPVIRADIEVIRGVAVGEVLRGLMYKGLVKIVGRAEILGRPMLYGTTKKFLEIFGLNTLKDLPKVEELKKPPA